MTRRNYLVACLAAAATCVMLRPVPAAIQGSPPVVAAVTFVGRVNVQEAPLLRALSLTPGKPFSTEKMETDRKALLELGYFRTVAAAHRTEGGRTAVTFRLVELPRVLHIGVTGNTVVDRRSILEVISTQRGQVLCAPQLQDDVRALEQLYRERGYVTRLDDKLLEEATRTGILKFALLEVRIGAVEVEGGTPELRRRAQVALTELPPQLYQPDAVSLDQRRLLRVRGIRNAVPRVQATEPGKVRIYWSINPPRAPAADSNGA
jgi:hemolysin activation/secretion protein